jgi:hypothetical protein
MFALALRYPWLVYSRSCLTEPPHLTSTPEPPADEHETPDGEGEGPDGVVPVPVPTPNLPPPKPQCYTVVHCTFIVVCIPHTVCKPV